MFRLFFFAFACSRNPLVYLEKTKFMAVVLHVTTKLPIACYKLGDLNFVDILRNLGLRSAFNL